MDDSHKRKRMTGATAKLKKVKAPKPPQIHEEGHSTLRNAGLVFIGLAAATALWMPRRWFYRISGASALLYGLIAYFFRQPQRQLPSLEGAVFSPADGTIVDIREVYEKEFLHRRCLRVSIFLSIFNVHMNWIPVGGRVAYMRYHPGQYLVAMHPKSSELNERHTVAIETATGEAVLVRQIAGLIARRIRWKVQPGQLVQAGEELGFIKFGSRVDIFLPLGSSLQVQRHQNVVGSETVLALLPASPQPENEAEVANHARP